jgi:uncharacterized protein YqgC (DUF456 family)
MNKIDTRKRGAAITTFNIAYIIIVVMVAVLIIPKDFWATEEIVAEIWAMHAALVSGLIYCAFKLREDCPLFGAILAVLVTATLLTKEYHFAFKTYAGLAVICILSLWAWKFSKRKWTGENNPRLAHLA